MREMKTDKNIILFKTNMEAGHGGASGRFKALEDVALIYAFLFSLEGITELKVLKADYQSRLRRGFFIKFPVG